MTLSEKTGPTPAELASDLAGLREERPRYFRHWLEQADPDTVEQIMTAILDTTIPPNKLANLLAGPKYGIPITRETIVRYRSDPQ